MFKQMLIYCGALIKQFHRTFPSIHLMIRAKIMRRFNRSELTYESLGHLSSEGLRVNNAP